MVVGDRMVVTVVLFTRELALLDAVSLFIRVLALLDGVSPSVFRCTSTPLETGSIVTCVKT